MEVSELTDEQIAKLTPEQIEILENNPERLDEIMGLQALEAAPGATPAGKPKLEDKSAANGAGDGEGSEAESAAKGAGDAVKEEEPVGVSTKNGKGIIPYEKHKELRVENSALRQQLQEAQNKLDELLTRKEEAKSSREEAKADDAIAQHLDRIREEMPELHTVIAAVLDGSRKQSEKLEQTLAELKREKEESDRVKQLSVAEQIAEAKENNPDLVHWESNDPEAWEEALRQDEILRTNSKWAGKPYAERFEEVARRVRAIMPDASAPKTQPDPDKIKAEAKAKVEKAPARKLTTLSDIQGGASPAATEAEQIASMNTLDLTKKLMSMPAHKAAALRTELD